MREGDVPVLILIWLTLAANSEICELPRRDLSGGLFQEMTARDPPLTVLSTDQLGWDGYPVPEQSGKRFFHSRKQGEQSQL
jgi:hypothetical protein